MSATGAKNTGSPNSVERRKFRTEIPNIVDDLGLSVYAYRLYGHVRRVAGESGECYQSTPTLAKACGMSAGKISDAKKELTKPRSELGGLPLIRIRKRDQPPGTLKRKGDSITIVDVWGVNHAVYSNRGKSRVHTVNGDVHHMSGYVHETSEDRSQGEIKKEPIEERTHEERTREERGTVASATSHSQATQVDGSELTANEVESDEINSTAIDGETDGVIEAEPVFSTELIPAPKLAPATGRAVLLPMPFQITAEMQAWAGEHVRAGVDIEWATEKFVVYHRGKYSDNWLKKWQIWMMNEKGQNYGKSTSERHAEIWANRDYDKLFSVSSAGYCDDSGTPSIR